MADVQTGFRWPGASTDPTTSISSTSTGGGHIDLEALVSS